ncbi:MAG: lamin tail domain-containing protein [Candidatus Eisenbacteria bacterium]|nr:lamin tail domain-containing protein [Candidatus Eisenbacteria bacterium]
MPTGGPLLPVLALALCAPSARPLVAEVFYDAVGDDTGWEFVELINPGARTASVAGLRLEAGDGSGPGRWTLRWTGGSGDSVAAGGRFVIGGAKVEPRPQAVVTLDLQNGPDAVRLVWPDGAVEVVGYGAHEFAEYSCGVPAPDVPAGQALARIPDDADLGSNALDFHAAAPSPGRANRPGRDVALIAGTLALAPVQPAPGEPARLAGLATNRGATALPAGAVMLTVSAFPPAGERVLVARPIASALAPADSAAFDEPLGALDEGKQWLRVRLALDGDEDPANDRDSLLVRCGPGPLELTEIQFHPAAGEGEWVEVRNRSGAPLDLAAFTLSDRGTGRGVPSLGEGALAPESLAVLAQERDALLAHYPALDPRRVWRVSPWSSLNNSDDSSGTADIVALREADGTPCEQVPYSAAGVPAGVPLERRDGGWWPASDPAGTPLSPPRPPPALASHFELARRRLASGATGHLAWALPWPRARLTVELYDLAGRRVARPIAEAAVPARGERDWAPGSLAPGVYVVMMRARPESGSESLSESRALRIEGAAR